MIRFPWRTGRPRRLTAALAGAAFTLLAAPAGAATPPKHAGSGVYYEAVTVPVRQLSVPNDTRMTNLLTGRPYTVKDGGVVVNVAGRSGAILAQ